MADLGCGVGRIETRSTFAIDTVIVMMQRAARKRSERRAKEKETSMKSGKFESQLHLSRPSYRVITLS